MQGPFPSLTSLKLQSADETLVVPDTFFSGSTPRLQYCRMDYIPFLALRTLLLSATRLVTLELRRIPHSGYVSPEAMVTCLSAATSLESLQLRFLSPRSRPDRRPPPFICTTLPALTNFYFHGVSEYLEDFISRIDAPRIDVVDITLFNQLTFDVSQLHQFVGRTENLSALNVANVHLHDHYTRVELSQRMSAPRPRIGLSARCDGSDWRLSFLAQACNSLSSHTVETLNVRENAYQSRTTPGGWEDGDVENGQWLELFHPFTSVKNLYVSRKLVPLVMPALQHLLAEERVTAVLSVLQNLYLEALQPSGPIRESIGQFVAARQLFNHPVTVIPLDLDGRLRYMQDR